MRAGVNPVDAIRAAGPRLHDVHMKDLAESNVKESQVAVGRGLMPIPEIFAELTKMLYPGYVDLEYEIHADDPMPGVIESIAYMRGVMTGMRWKS
jgi:sugar phosphate isomerase/epimerase